MLTRYLFITGGVCSSLGKGILCSSLGALLKSAGFSIKILKLDPYLNTNPGTLGPYEHGEVFITEDGAETDLDLGHYERFTGLPSSRSDNLTAGQVYQNLILKESTGEYLGKTVQVIPHVCNLIKKFILTPQTDFVICEIGGTVGDIEGQPFLESIRQMKNDLGSERVMYLHLTLLPYVGGELKTKPTQHSLKELRASGIFPDLVICRADREISREVRTKIALFSSLTEEKIIPNLDLENIYQLPLKLAEDGLIRQIRSHFSISIPSPNLEMWHFVIQPMEKEVSIGIIGKYTRLKDAYISLVEALTHAGISLGYRVLIQWINARELEDLQVLTGIKGMIVPGGFGYEGYEGKIKALQYAREHHIPCLGICLGMQLMMIEYARNVLKLPMANSQEADNETRDPVVVKMDGSMRLGASQIKVVAGTRAETIYGRRKIRERHRHRYEINRDYIPRLEKEGLVISGWSEEGGVEIIEDPTLPYYLGVQFHPEFQSTPFCAHPLFRALLKVVIGE